MYFNARFWSRFFEDSFSRQIRMFCAVLEERVLPVFADADSEAEEAAEREYERLGNLPGGPDGPVFDMGDAAEMAREAGLAHYEMMTGTRQTFLNLAAAALYHTFEQQLLVFHRRQVLSPAEEHDTTINDRLRVLRQRLEAAGIRLESLEAWDTVAELELVANTIKHGEGRSARALREVRPGLFTPPVLHGTALDKPLGTVNQPLAGEDIYVTVADIRRYRDALLSFWDAFGRAILENQLEA